MPATETQKQRTALLNVVFWLGIGLTPLAAALVLLSSGSTGLRLASVLAILAVAMIGLAIMLRPDAAKVRAEVEDMVFEELDVLREDVREDISTAARATHKAFSEKLQQLHETVDMLRQQVEAARAQGFQTTAKAPAPPPGRPNPNPSVGTAMVGGGVVRHTETVQVTTRQTIVDPHAEDHSGTVYAANGTVYGGARPGTPAGAPAGRRAAGPAEERAPDRHADWVPREESWTEQRLRERRAAEAPEPPRERHTRDEFPGRADFPAREDFPGRDDFHGRDEFHSREEFPGRADFPGGGEFPGRADFPGRGDFPGRADFPGRGDFQGEGRDEFRLDPSRRPRPFDRDEDRLDDAGDDPRWTDLRAGDRWASVRTDDRGREVRMGERRAAVHNDGAGTELRIEDRWAQVRREDARRRGEHHEADPGSFNDVSGSWSEPGRERRGAQPALPAAPAEPASSWTEGWAQEQREPVRRRRGEERDDRWERDESGRGSARPRRPEFELNDERWR